MFGVHKEVFVICLEKSANKCLYQSIFLQSIFVLKSGPINRPNCFEEFLKSSLLCGEKCVVNNCIRSSPSALIFETWHSLASHHLERWLKYFLLLWQKSRQKYFERHEGKILIVAYRMDETHFLLCIKYKFHIAFVYTCSGLPYCSGISGVT